MAGTDVLLANLSVNPSTGLLDPNYIPQLQGLTLLKKEDFQTGSLADKPWILQQTGNEDYCAIVTALDGKRVMRNNLSNKHGTTPDPISGKLRGGIQVPRFAAATFHTGANDTSVTYTQKTRYDKCFWDAIPEQADMAYPKIAGKVYIQDATVGTYAMYFAVLYRPDEHGIHLTAANGVGSGGTWSQGTSGGWTSRDYGWKNTDGVTPANYIKLYCPIVPFASDGVTREIKMQIKYNPAGLGHHLIRFLINDQIMYDGSGVNSGVDGWLACPPEFKFNGMSSMAGTNDMRTFQDVTTNPELYDGYACGNEVLEYTISSGVEE